MELENRDDVLDFVPFDEDVKNTNILSLFTTNFQKLYYKLENLHQVFMPIGDEKTEG
jgi:hypothetical protein